MSVLQTLLSLLFPPRRTEISVKTVGADGLMRLRAPASFTLKGVTGTGLLSYKDETVRAFILEAKFHDNAAAQSALGAVLADHLRSCVAAEASLGRKVTLIPIPLGKKRKNERGYNQVEAVCTDARERLSEAVHIHPLLTRTRETLPQTKLTREKRRINMQGAFAVTGDLDPSHTYIVIDDVITTGATLASAIAAIKEGGASRVMAVALAH